jgi:hypothetical protein
LTPCDRSIPKIAELLDYPQWRQQPEEGQVLLLAAHVFADVCDVVQLEDFFDGNVFKKYVRDEGVDCH